MTEPSKVAIRERTLPEVKAEITRRAGHLNPLDGIHAEDAERISKALTNFEPELRSVLKKGGFLTRDSRTVERKKYGKAKARKSFQFSKR